MTKQIIVIDNDERMRETLVINLVAGGWKVSGYAYASIDLVALEQFRADLIILDFNILDEGIGWEFLQMLKMDDATANLPILITTTASRFSAEIEDYLLTRYIRVVYKPYDIDTFLPLVQHTLTLASQAGVIYSSDHPLPILVVEDSPDLQDALATVLRLEGYQVVTADNGMFALDAMYKADHCLILLDIRMPVMDGLEFLRVYDRQLRPHSPVIILSGEPYLLTKIFPAFVIDVFPKPYEISQLLTVVQKYAQPA